MPETIFVGHLRGSGQTVEFAAPCSSVRLRHRARTPDEVPDTLAESFSRSRFARRSPRHSGFPSAAAALRPAEASAPASETTASATADGVGAGATDDTADTSVGQSVGASDDGTDNSPCATVCTRGQDCSAQSPRRLRSAVFAGVDSPIASHKILGYRDALRRLDLTPNASLMQVLQWLRLSALACA